MCAREEAGGRTKVAPTGVWKNVGADLSGAGPTDSQTGEGVGAAERGSRVTLGSRLMIRRVREHQPQGTVGW